MALPHTYAQDAAASLQGLVTDIKGEPVSYVNVTLEGTTRGVYTDVNGRYTIQNLKPGDYEIVFSAVGFKKTKQIVSITSGQLEKLDLSLEEDVQAMPQVTVIASKDRLFSKVPGAVSYINKKELQMLQPISGNEALRRVPGVHVVDEEGAGLRTNIGIRGLDPDRSRSVLILEDGVPVALNPYGEPEMYFTPSIDRMEGVEILKGSGQVLYGPQTIGGVVNYITANPPEEAEGRVKMQGGEGGYFSGLVGYGTTFGNTGVQVNLLRKQADNLGPTQFQLTDFNTKLKLQLSDRAKLGFKLGVYDEVSNATYVGLTQSMFESGGQDYLRISPDDQLDVRRYSLSANHEYNVNENLQFLTTVFGYTTTRNWRRQDFSYDSEASNQTGVVWGDEDVPGGAIYMRNTTGNRNRQFEVAGIEPRMRYNYQLGDVDNELKAGIRYMYERAYEQRVNGSFPQAVSGNLVQDEVRTGRAFSAFAQNKFILDDAWSVNLGLRYELYDFEREILRNNFGGNVLDTMIAAGSMTQEIIPGAGVNYKVNPYLNLFAGVHRGFAPPRVKDAITAEGDALDLEAERSWNTELGLRASPHPALFVELTAFRMAFSNQIIPVAESAGGLGFGLVNAGSTLHQGLELGTQLAIHELINTGLIINYDINASYINAFFNEDRFIQEENINGNRTPYAPEYLISSAFTVEAQNGIGFRLNGTFVGQQFTDERNTFAPSANGRTGELPSYFMLDASAQYNIPKINTIFNISVKNLTDERYIATRRPQGIRVGLPRFITAGFDIRF